MAIDKSSSEYMFGQIMARLSDGDKSIGVLCSKVDAITKAVGKLPCNLHRSMIDDILGWQRTKNHSAQVASQTSLKLKHGLIIGITSAIASAGFAVLFIKLLV